MHSKNNTISTQNADRNDRDGCEKSVPRKNYTSPSYRRISIADETELLVKTAVDGLTGKGLS